MRADRQQQQAACTPLMVLRHCPIKLLRRPCRGRRLLKVTPHITLHRTLRYPPVPGPQRNFGKPVEWALVKDYEWSTPALRKLEVPVDVDGNPWPVDKDGQPILKT